VTEQRWFLPWLLLGVLGCSRGPMTPPASSFPLTPSTSPSGRCSIAEDPNAPLVTEWSAAEKAHLESLMSRQVVAVEYSGCELRLVPECRLPGSYTWSLTTLATDTVDIDSADELYAKLPLGAVSLESELEQSGALEVRTTVAGQLRLGESDVQVPKTGACSAATHWVRALSVGAFKLFSGGQSDGDTTLGGPATGRNKTRARRSVLREAGRKEACAAATETAADPQCASPIQLFLEPVGRRQQDERTARARQSGAVRLALAAPENSQESWSLRDRTGRVLCGTPCEYWVTPASGFYLEREAQDSEDAVKLALPDGFPVAPAGRLVATYRAERGAPFTSKLMFWGLGVPVGVTGVLFMGVSIRAFAQDDCDSGCQFERGAIPIMGLAYLASAGGLYYWYSWSHEQSLTVVPASDDLQAGSVAFGPGFVHGRF
jgi:hypothetical protein